MTHNVASMIMYIGMIASIRHRSGGITHLLVSLFCCYNVKTDLNKKNTNKTTCIMYT